MNRFPERYDKPKLLSVVDGINAGWTLPCTTGDTNIESCSTGINPGTSGDGFIDPEVLHQTERRSNLLTD